VKQSAAFIPLVYAVPGLSGAAAAFVLITGRKPKMPRMVTDAAGRLRRLFSSRLARNSGSGNA
jgi:lipopolysaccharide export system permease protein